MSATDSGSSGLVERAAGRSRSATVACGRGEGAEAVRIEAATHEDMQNAMSREGEEEKDYHCGREDSHHVNALNSPLGKHPRGTLKADVDATSWL